MGFWYLSTPYSKYPAGRSAAYHEAANQAALLIEAGLEVFCPISHSHTVSDYLDPDNDNHDTWMRVDDPFIRAATGLIVCKMEGWEESVGVAEEMRRFKAQDKPIIYMEPGLVPEVQLKKAARPAETARDENLKRWEALVKPTNPKDACGIRKVPFSTVPAQVTAEVGLAMLEGALKYGRHNYRAIGVRASVYYDAAKRHLSAWWEGEDLDPESGLPHVTHALACLVIVRDADRHGKLTDDRPPKTPAGWLAELNAKAADLLEKYPAPKPAFTEANKTDTVSA